MADSPRDCETILAQAATLVRPLIRSRVHALPPQIRHVAGLHFGWWTDDGTVLDAPAVNKGIRPALALLACRAVGADPYFARAAAVAVELVHNASLLHDDIIDQDPLRRGRPALWTAKGVPAAILAGDALFFAAVQTLAEAPDADRTVPVLLAAVQALIEGEYLDTLMEAGTDVSEGRASAVAAGKTGALLACACELGAIAGGATEERARLLHGVGRRLGIAYQCVDDVLGIWGEEPVTGKPALSDLRSRKVTVPVAAAMAGHTPQAQSLRALYAANGPLGEEDYAQARTVIEQTGAREATLRRARRHTEDALHLLDQVRPEPSAAAELAALADLITHRDH
ncbi:dimethylallyltransferase [Streptomyces violarus]|uniref:Geranylgeranyl diphosphate synthase type I n=1 Tax=Streptomyces violarus TaxID=67380 RepID=A0A7W5F0F0_9ACTN|nr:MULTISPECIES: polyprenyl synthetase family protein [Streptomyces]MBB3075467.1 geranylgeranyl diphosphate synthase type I [Streptomyces violarus]WRT98069.1 polyprenyl synthetase family protein [Streptomyces sp. CGMCC 4.1772]GHD03872.1 dimethylallyltransferase [Streptomyces violarus]